MKQSQKSPSILKNSGFFKGYQGQNLQNETIQENDKSPNNTGKSFFINQQKKSVNDGQLSGNQNGRSYSQYLRMSLKPGEYIDIINSDKNLKKKISNASEQGLLKRESSVILLQKFIQQTYVHWSEKFCCKKKHMIIKSIPTSQVNLTEKSLTEQINDVIIDLNGDEITEKALRHFKDAYYQRQYRNDIDGHNNRQKRELWLFLNSFIWKFIIILTSVIYQLLVFAEPVNQFISLNYQNFKTTAMIEMSCLFIITIDTALSFVFQMQTSKKDLFKNKVLLCKGILNILMITDYLYYTISYPIPICRFSRFLRPSLLICYSQNVSRNVTGVLKSLKHLGFLLVLQMIVILIFAFIGSNLMSDVKDSQKIDQYTTDYGDFFKFSFILFTLGNKEYIPDLIIAPMNYSIYYLCYFIPYILLFVFFLIPVPQAMVFECYHLHRKKLRQQQDQNLKEALAVSFYCIDIEESGTIQFDQALNFFKTLYKNNVNPDFIQIISILKNKENTFSMDEFLQIFLIIKKYPKFSIDRFQAPKFWDDFRFYLNNKLHLKKIMESVKYTLFMFFVTLTNCILIITTLTLKDSVALYDLNFIDQIFFIVYAIEAITKLLALGVYDYLEDRWNIFDLLLLIIQFFSDFVFVDILQAELGQTIQTNRVLRFARIQRIPRLFKAFRLVKVVTIFLHGLEVFQKAQDLLFKIISTAPILLEFLTIVWAVFYSYGVLSVEILAHPDDVTSYYEGNHCDRTFQESLEEEYIVWAECKFSDFSSIGNAFLMFFQMQVSRWGDILNDYAHKTGDFTKVAFFIGSFELTMAFLQAIMNGLVWDVFNQEFQDDSYKESLQAGIEECHKSIEEKNEDGVQEENVIVECKVEEENNSNSSSSRRQQIHQEYDHQTIQAELPGEKLKKFIKSNKFTKERIHIEFSESDDFCFIYENLDIPVEETEIYLIAKSNIEQKQRVNNMKLKQLNDDKAEIQSQFIDLKSNSRNYTFLEFVLEEFKNLCDEKFIHFQERLMIGSKRSNEHTIAKSLAFFYKSDTPETENNLKNMLRNQVSQFGFTALEDNPIQELLEYSKQLPQHLSYLLKFKIEQKQLLNILIGTDQMINKDFLNQKSFTKTIFQHNNGRWFTFTGKEKIKYISIDLGPWDFFNQSSTESEINPGQNIFFYEFKNEPNTEQTEYEILMRKSLNNLFFQFKQQAANDEVIQSNYLQLKSLRSSNKHQNEDSCILISRYPYETNQNTQTKQIMQIWYLRYDKAKHATFKISYFKKMKKTTDNQPNALLNYFETGHNNKSLEDSPSSSLLKEDQPQLNSLNFEETIELASDVWRCFRGHESFIRQQIDEISKQRERKRKNRNPTLIIQEQ